jgi:molybdenum cofactor cytidylyltransferase
MAAFIPFFFSITALPVKTLRFHSTYDLFSRTLLDIPDSSDKLFYIIITLLAANFRHFAATSINDEIITRGAACVPDFNPRFLKRIFLNGRDARRAGEYYFILTKGSEMIELRVSALLLARGTKAPGRSLPEGKTAIARCIDALLASGIQETVVITGSQAEIMNEYLGLPVRFVVSAAAAAETAGPVKTGLASFDNLPTGVLLCLADYPFASIRTIRTLALEHYSFCGKILVPAYHGKMGHPVLFPRDILSEVSDGLSLRETIRKDPRRVRMIDVPDEGIVVDVNTRPDVLLASSA